MSHHYVTLLQPWMLSQNAIQSQIIYTGHISGCYESTTWLSLLITGETVILIT